MQKSTQNNTQFIETHYNVTVVSVDIMLKSTQNNTQFIETHTYYTILESLRPGEYN